MESLETEKGAASQVEFQPKSLSKKIESLNPEREWTFGPIDFTLLASPTQLSVDWALHEGAKKAGVFSDRNGERWVYSASEDPKGKYFPRRSVRNLMVFKMKDDGSLDKAGGVQLAYSITEKDSFSFSALMDDSLGNTAYLKSGLEKQSETQLFLPSWNVVYTLMDNSFRVDKQHQQVLIEESENRLIPQMSISRDSVMRWLTARHLRDIDFATRNPDILEIFRLEEIDPFSSGFLANPLWPEKRSGKLVSVSEYLLQAAGDHIGRTLFPFDTDFLRDPSVTINILSGRESFSTLNMRKAIALTIIVHRGPNWLCPMKDLDLGEIEILAGMRAEDRPMAGKFSILSGKLTPDEGTGDVTGAVLGGLRELGEEVVLKEGGREVGTDGNYISTSPVWITGGYIDIHSGSQEPFEVINGVMIIADPKGKLDISWSRLGQQEFSGEPKLISLKDLKNHKLLDKFHPGVLIALQQSLNEASKINYRYVGKMMLNRKEEISMRRKSAG